MLSLLCQRRCVPNDKDWIIFLIGWTKFWVDPLGIWLKSLWYSPKCVHMTRCERARGLQVLFCILKSTPTAPAVVTWKRFLGCVWKLTQWVMTEEVRNEAEQQVHAPPPLSATACAGRPLAAAYTLPVCLKGYCLSRDLSVPVAVAVGSPGWIWKVSASSDRAPFGKDK